MSVSELLNPIAPNWSNIYVNSLTAGTVTAGIINGPSGDTGTFDNLILKNLYVNDVYPNTSGGATGIRFHENALGPDPIFSFEAIGTGNVLNSSIMKVEDQSSGFNHPNAAVLFLNAPNSVSYGGTTCFIRCNNAGASGGTAGGAPGGVTGGVSGGANLTSGLVFVVSGAGVVTSNGYYQYSSEEYKKNVEHLVLDSKQLKKIKPSFYHYGPADDSEKKRLGMMYEELEELCPEICHCDELGKKIDLNAEIGLIFALLKDLEQRISNLEAKFSL